LVHTGSNIALKGVAQSNARVSALMRNLAASDWFADPELEVITVKPRGSDRVSEFSMRVKPIAKQQKKIEDTGT
jgi:type IV pilus assembly protein PilN